MQKTDKNANAGKTFKRVRLRMAAPRRRLARALSISNRQLMAYETGRETMPMDILEKIFCEWMHGVKN